MKLLYELKAKREELVTKQRAIFEAHPQNDFSAEQLNEIKGYQAELETLAPQIATAEKEHAELELIRKSLPQSSAADRYSGGSSHQSQAQGQSTATKALHELIGEHVEFKNYLQRGNTGVASFKLDLDRKALFDSTSFAPESTRSGRIEFSALRRPVIADLMPNVQTNQAVLKFMHETTFTNNAAAVAEGADKPESTIEFDEVESPVRKIATWIPVTDEQLRRGLEPLVRNRLQVMLALAEESQLLTGDGVAPNIKGFSTWVTQTQAKGADPVPDAIHKAITKVRTVGFDEPSAIIMHPNDWQDVRLLRTADGVYIWGNPSEVGMATIWGLPVITTTAQAENTAFLGNFAGQSQISRDGSVMVKVGWINDYFTKNKQVILIEEYLGLEVYRANSFCYVTGI